MFRTMIYSIITSIILMSTNLKASEVDLDFVITHSLQQDQPTITEMFSSINNWKRFRLSKQELRKELYLCTRRSSYFVANEGSYLTVEELSGTSAANAYIFGVVQGARQGCFTKLIDMHKKSLAEFKNE